MQSQECVLSFFFLFRYSIAFLFLLIALLLGNINKNKVNANEANYFNFFLLTKKKTLSLNLI